MKIARSGKGGVGKSTLAAAFAMLMARQDQNVLAVDADPDANLAAALGIPAEKQKDIIPISRQVELIEERTGAKVRQYGQIFKLNPKVSDIGDNYAYIHKGIALLVLGPVEQGGSGCACPENVLIRALVTDMILYKDEALVMDMEAGVEHLGRATARGVDTMIVVIEPGQRAIDCAKKVVRMSNEIGLKDIQFVANKVSGPRDEQFIRNAFPTHELLGLIPYSEEIRRSDRDGLSVLDGLSKEMNGRFQSILDKLKSAHKF
jgi:CO dehydrogenase maturation factor